MMPPERSSQKGFLTYLIPLVCLALGVRLFLAVSCPGNLRPDETFQYLEPAHHLAFGPWIETWEWRAGIRSWLVPSFIAEIFRLAAVLHLRDMVLAVRVVFAGLSLLPVVLFCWAGWQHDRGRGALLFGLVAALWPDMVTAGIRPLGECFGGNLLVSGVILAFLALQRKEGRQDGLRSILLGCAAFLLGCAAAVRFQFAPGVGVAMLYLLAKGRNRDRFTICVACALPVLVLGGMDKALLGQWYQSVFKNYYMNIHMGVANTFGKKSFLYFFKKYSSQWGVLALAVLALCVRGWRYCRFPLCIGLVIVGYHSLIGHKEVSFIYPAVPLLLFCVCYGLDDFLQQTGSRMKWVAPCLAVALWLFMQSSYLPQWQQHSEIAKLQQEAGRKNDLCGLAFFVPEKHWPEWSNTLGYSGMPRGEPFYLAPDVAGLANLAGRYNYMIAYKGTDQAEPGLEEIDCGDTMHICLYRRALPCEGTADYEQFSRMLEAGGR